MTDLSPNATENLAVPDLVNSTRLAVTCKPTLWKKVLSTTNQPKCLRTRQSATKMVHTQRHCSFLDLQAPALGLKARSYRTLSRLCSRQSLSVLGITCKEGGKKHPLHKAVLGRPYQLIVVDLPRRTNP